MNPMSLLISAALVVLPMNCQDQAADTTPPASACTGEHRNEVDSLQFSYGNMEPVDATFRMVAADCHWDQASIDAWTPFLVYDVIAKESGGCWNVRRGVRFANGGANCEIARQGRGSDSGFGQLISIHYRPGKGWLCNLEGLCSADQITANPYDSMKALVLLIVRPDGNGGLTGSGKHGWCYSARAIKYHPGCRHAPAGLPTLVG